MLSKPALPAFQWMQAAYWNHAAAVPVDNAQIQPMIEAAVKYGAITKSFPASEIIIN